MLSAHGLMAIGLDDAGIAYSPDEEGIEVFDTFEANASAKARHFATIAGLPCMADDSGLCVDALDGAPGVHSRRFARDQGCPAADGDAEEQANNAAVLDACWNSGWAPPWRAHYACAAAYAGIGGECVAMGRTDGHISPDPDGGGGFGYDPYFVSSDLGISFARAAGDAKARVSHRARAVSTLLSMLRERSRNV